MSSKCMLCDSPEGTRKRDTGAWNSVVILCSACIAMCKRYDSDKKGDK